MLGLTASRYGRPSARQNGRTGLRENLGKRTSTWRGIRSLLPEVKAGFRKLRGCSHDNRRRCFEVSVTDADHRVTGSQNIVLLLLLLWVFCRGIPVCERIGTGEENHVKLEGARPH